MDSSNKALPESHFATYPEELIVDCIKPAVSENDMILDPFMGAGTTALVVIAKQKIQWV